MLCACYGFSTQNIHLLMALLFVSGTHSTFFGPIKYSILPEQLRAGELLAGNGFVSGGTYIGILAGLIAGGLLIEAPGNAIGFTALGMAVAGLIASLCIPRGVAAHPQLPFSFHIVRGTMDIVRHARHTPAVFYSILGLSWFLLVGSVYMSQFPNYAQGVVYANNEVYTLFLAVFSIGIALGSVACDRLLKGEISARYAAPALLGITVFTYLLVLMTPRAPHAELLTVGQFLGEWKHWPVLAAMLLVAVSGGIYMVPLYAILQAKSENASRSRVIAASNLFDSLFMTVAASVCALLLAMGIGVLGLFLAVATLNLGVYAYARTLAARHSPAAA